MQKIRLNLQYFASGTIDGSSTASNCDCRIVWSSTKNDANNQSTVTASIQVYKSGSNTTTCTFEGTIKIDGTSYSVSKYNSWAWGSWHTIGTKTKTVTHNADGTKAISISGSVKTPTSDTTMTGTYSASGTATLDTINRASKLGEIDNFGIANTITIPITKYVSTFTDKLVISYGNTTIKTINSITNGYQLTFSSAEQNTIKSLMKSPQIALTFTLTTLNGTTTLGTSVQSVVVTSLDQPIFRHVIKKSNGKYQVAINGLVDTTNEAPLQVYDDDGNLVSAKVDDTGWVNLTPAVGTWSYLQYRRIGKQVFIRGRASAYGWSDANKVLATVPNEIIPSNVAYAYSQLAGGRIGRVGVNVVGQLFYDWVYVIKDGSSYATSTWHQFNFSYFID